MRRASVILWFKPLNKLVSIHNSSLNNGDIEIDKITPWIRLLHRSRVTPAWVFILLAVTGGQGIRAVYPPLTSLKNESTSCRWNTPPVLTLSVQVRKLLQEEGLLTARWSCLFVCLFVVYLFCTVQAHDAGSHLQVSFKVWFGYFDQEKQHKRNPSHAEQ